MKLNNYRKQTASELKSNINNLNSQQKQLLEAQFKEVELFVH